MDISKLDKNFAVGEVTETDVEWLEIDKPPFSLHGVFYDGAREEYRRMPKSVSERVSAGVDNLASHTSGGRVRFATDSPYVSIKAIVPTGWIMPHMTVVGSHGFALYADNVYQGMYVANARDLIRASENGGQYHIAGTRYLPQKILRDITICFPLYNGVKKLYVGVKKGSVLKACTPYAYQKPVVFYGSSITQGGCASHAGNDYAALVCRHLHADYLNLGFSGNAKGEAVMTEYLADLDASVYVIDYDHNAPNAEHLQATHLPLYETLRTKRKDTPIIFMSKPDFDYDPCGKQRRAVIESTYLEAKRRGDTRVWFIDGQTLFGKADRDACAVDTCHPNDLGFYRMAQAVEPILKEALSTL